MRFFLLHLVMLLVPAAQVLGQSAVAAAPLAFEVASVRPSRPGSASHSNLALDSGFVYGTIGSDDARAAAGGYVLITHQPLWRYIAFAYSLTGTQELALRFSVFSGVPKSGAPFWVTGSFDGAAEAFDVSARAAAGSTTEQMRVMMQSLLVERFHLVTHYQTADAPVFALTLIRKGVLGPNLQAHPIADRCGVPVQDQASAPTRALPSGVGEVPPVCGIVAHVPSSEPGEHFGGRAIGLPLFATTIPTMTGLAAMPRPVVDETGLSGLYDFTLHWMHDSSGDQAIGDNSANFRDALKTQLGLQLKASHAPLPFLIVDHVERPAEN